MLTATSDRVRDLTVLRLTGATDGQVLRLLAAESLTVTAVGTLLGLLVAGLSLAGMGAALHLLAVPAAPVVPWAAVATAAGTCAVLTVAASLTSATLLVRRRAVVRE
ncbi:FtsX-like permease family protein [Streptomyces tendae]